MGVAKVPDDRVDALAELYQPPKITFATVEYIDAPAISKETLRDPAYLASLRVVDAFAHVLRVFQDEICRMSMGRWIRRAISAMWRWS